AVEAVLPIQGVMGARLSGGGFGGSVVALVVRDRMESIREDWSRACSKLWKRKPEIRIVRPSAGARLVRQTS
ncbi:MAG: galactokinase, partial [Kiritimatiellia bacterium]|nr:galactokinase [Kiritimatiellia bacterium]